MALKTTLTSTDLKLIERRLTKKFATKNDLKGFATKDDLQELRDELLTLFAQYKSDLMDKMDAILKEIIASREKQTILAHKSSDHEDRIEKLEASVFPQ